MKLGSLFDGSGGFPLAGLMNGIEPVWSSEIEPYPMKVTAARFPNMVQLGDVTKIKGAEIEPVDVITFGSPCQDLSVAGKQAGIHDGERSNLFFEAVRIIKEMREHDRNTGRADEYLRPRFAVWENVPGAFSSNKGADFQAVLQALCEVADPCVSVPACGKWQKAGCIVGDGYSVAWRVYDAQFWGVPQRRKRIYLVADFASERAGEILFKSEGVCRDSAQGGETREGTAADAEGSFGGNGKLGLIDSIGGQAERGWIGNHSPTLKACHCKSAPVLIFEPASVMEENWVARDVKNALRASESKSSHAVVYAVEGNTIDRNSNKNGKGWGERVAPTLNTQDRHAVSYQEVTGALCMDDHKGPNRQYVDQNKLIVYPAITGALCANSHPGSYTGQDAFNDMLPVIKVDKPPRKYIARRLTPLECCRLQGFPDWWEDGVEGSDSARYKMWGNGIALPCAEDVLRRIANAD